MCTLSWLPERGGYSLFFNRDESRLRGSEIPAAPHQWDGAHLVAPLDSDQGGTWIAANEFGVTVAVLNRYGPEMTRIPGRRSRGQLVRSLAPTATPGAVRRRLAELLLTDYQPFTLATTGPDSPVYLLAWNGETPRGACRGAAGVGRDQLRILGRSRSGAATSTFANPGRRRPHSCRPRGIPSFPPAGAWPAITLYAPGRSRDEEFLPGRR